MGHTDEKMSEMGDELKDVRRESYNLRKSLEEFQATLQSEEQEPSEIPEVTDAASELSAVPKVPQTTPVLRPFLPKVPQTTPVLTPFQFSIWGPPQPTNQARTPRTPLHTLMPEIDLESSRSTIDAPVQSAESLYEAAQELSNRGTRSWCRALYEFLAGVLLILVFFCLVSCIARVVVQRRANTVVYLHKLQLRRKGSTWVPTKKLTIGMKLDSCGRPKHVAARYRKFKARPNLGRLAREIMSCHGK